MPVGIEIVWKERIDCTTININEMNAMPNRDFFSHFMTDFSKKNWWRIQILDAYLEKKMSQ